MTSALQMTHRSILATIGVALLLVACSSAAAPSVPPASPTATPSASPSADASDALPSPSLTPASASPAKGELLSGTLGFDQIEGGCSYVEARDGTRYQVLYPDGYAIDRSSGDLTGPDGAVVAQLGAELQLRGAVDREMVTICQIGPVFRASEVVAP